MIAFCEEHGIQYHIKEKTITEGYGDSDGVIVRLNSTDR